ncbi:hypothetical protein KP509_21G025200 [Ceratopteris richardii]|uniref:Uncharacterized protein n=1 Tax=Ceratopteris richardii TaxID=49495 RepID=A0A8T2SA94_CERRI|nr:hypothetical protein KP509_21G025200 [Ceratopteris richardii]
MAHESHHLPSGSKLLQLTFFNCIALSRAAPKYGQHSIGTPCAIASMIEFHPQCVMNPPMDGCASTSTCETHSTISPLPSHLDKMALSSDVDMVAPSMRSGRQTHRKRCCSDSKDPRISFT